MNLLSQKKRNGKSRRQTKNYKRNKSKKLKTHRKYQLKGGADFTSQFQKGLQSRVNFFHPPLDEQFETDYEYIKTKFPTSQPRFTATGAIVPYQQGTGIDGVNENLLSINNGMIEEPQDSSVISFVDLRGVVIKDNFRQVPPNTMICFISPLDNSVSPNFNRDSSLLYSILNMNKKQYNNLFRFRMGMRQSAMITEKIRGEELPMIYSNCLSNSYWVYPGELYPEMKFMVDCKAFRQDPDTEKCLYITLRMGADRVSVPVENQDAVSPQQLLTQPFIRDIRLSDIVSCPSRDETVRLIMVLSSRNLEHRSQYSELELRRLMNLELYNYEMNKVLERKILGKMDVLQQINFENHPISATCGYVDLEMERLTFFEEHSFTNMIHRTYNLNYHTMVPKLQDIYRQIPDVVRSSNVRAVSYKYVSFCRQSDAYFIGGLSPKIILSFLIKVLRGEGFPADIKLERRRISTFFRTISEGLALSMLKIYQYIQKTANFIQFFAESTIQKELYEVCHIIMKFLTENDFFLKDSLCYKLEESVKLFKKSKSFEALLKESIKSGDAVLPYLICDIPDELLEMEEKKINRDTTLEFRVSEFGLPSFSNLSKLGTLVLTSNTYHQSVKLDLTHQLLQLRSLVLGNLNLDSLINLKELYPNLQSLSISSCEISKGTLESVPLLIKLEKLTLEKLNLQEPIRMNFFDMLSNLKQLKLSKLGQIKPIIHLNNINLEVVIVEDVQSVVFERSLKLQDLQISGLQYEGLFGFPSRLPDRVGNLILVNCESITPQNLVLPEGIKIDSLLLSSNTLDLNTVNQILEKTKITKLEAKNNDFELKGPEEGGLRIDGITFTNELSTQTKLKNIYLVNNKFSQPARIAQAFLEPLKLDSLVIKHNENLTMDLKSIKVKGKKVLHN